jgi:molecular chaperone DnaK
MYADAQAAAAQAGGAAPGADAGEAPQADAARPADDNVVDAEFKEVKDKK